MSLERAIVAARMNPITCLPRMAAVVVHRRMGIIGIGVNSRKTDPLAKKYGKHPEALCLHAEVAAIKRAMNEIESHEFAACTLYVARVLKDDTPALAKPCIGCQRAILEFGIGNVEWTT